MQYDNNKQNESYELYNNFINDEFNWMNSKYKVYSGEPVTTSQNKKLFWTPDDIKDPYQVNSMAYRSDEFSETRDIIFAGCSQTWGEGVVLDGIWGNILSRSLDKKSYNLGIGSKGVQFIVKNIISFCKEYGNPKVVFCLFPEFTRIQMKSHADFMVSKNTHTGSVGRHEYSLVPNKINPEKDTKYSKAPHFAEDMIPSEFLFSINLDYIHMLELYCKSNNIKLFWGTWDGWQDDCLHRNIGSTDFKNYVYLEQDKWNFSSHDRYLENFYSDNTYTTEEKCHEEYRQKYGMNFDFAMDQNPKTGLPGERVVLGHMQVHKHIHVAERFEQAFKNDSN
jgi:hypothetical protein